MTWRVVDNGHEVRRYELRPGGDWHGGEEEWIETYHGLICHHLRCRFAFYLDELVDKWEAAGEPNHWYAWAPGEKEVI